MATTGLQHVLVLSDDIDASRAFYDEVVGLRPGPRPALAFPGHWLYAGADDVACLHIADRGVYRTHAAELGLDAGAGPAPGGGVDHIAFDADDPEAIERRISQAGLRAVRNQVPGGPLQLFVSDPDGVLVEFSVPSPDAGRAHPSAPDGGLDG